MHRKPFHFPQLLLFLSLTAAPFELRAQQAAPAPYSGLTRAQKENFLLNAKVVKTETARKGITKTLRATLSDGKITHDASIQRIDESKIAFQTAAGTELMFTDKWEYNIAGYRLDKLLGLNMVPATVARSYHGDGSFSWWVEDVQMDEETRQQRKLQAPDRAGWNREMHMVNVFSQLIYNTDLNMTNLLIDKDWHIWMIDFTRAFRTNPALLDPRVLVQCDSGLLAKMKLLDEAALKKELSPYIGSIQIKGLLERRDKIVKIFEDKGPSALFSIPRRPE